MEARITMRAIWSGWRALVLSGAVLLGMGEGARSAQAQAPFAPQGSISAELQSLARRAATIFVGQITSIERKGAVVEVTFRVEQPISGSAGDLFVLREWAGQWAPATMRYTPGQRALVFAHGASGAGFSSPVDGALGLVPVIVQGAAAPELVDIRRLAAAILRAPGTPLPTAAEGAIQLGDALKIIASGPTQTTEPGHIALPGRGTATEVWRTISSPESEPQPIAIPGRSPRTSPVQEGGVHAAR
jgi:hypothetical protein